MSLLHILRYRPLLAVCVSLCAVAGCQPANEYVEPPPPEVDVATPIQQDVMAYLETTGTTAPVEIVEIRPRVTGFLEEIHFMPPGDANASEPDGTTAEVPAAESSSAAPGPDPENSETAAGTETAEAPATEPAAEQEPQFVAEGPGSDVKQGDRLYTIEKDVYQATLNQAKAALEVARAKAEDAKAKYARARPLAEKGAVSPEELFEKAAEYQVGQAAIEAARADVEQAELDLNYTTIRSPINGRVGKTLVDRGNLVSETQESPLTTVIRWDEIYANFNISERALLDLRTEMRKRGVSNESRDSVPVLIGLEDEQGYPHAGELDYADLAVDISTGTFLLRAIFDNEDKVIIPGAFVRVRIPLGVVEGALFVPEVAVGSDQRGRYVLTVDDANKVVRRDVILGNKFGELIRIEEGLQAGEKVIIEGLQRARPGAVVAPQTKSLEVTPELREASPETASADAAGEPGEPAGPATPDSETAPEQPAS